MDIEDGEIVESEEELPKTTEDSFDLEVYNRIERPVAPRPPAQPQCVVSSDDERPPGARGSSGDSSDDSDQDARGKRRRQLPAAATEMDTVGHNAAFAEAARHMQARRARLNVWTSVLAEDGITEDMAGGLGYMLSGPRIERDVESYQLPESRSKRDPPPGSQPINDRKRGFQKAQQGWKKKRKQVVMLKDLEVKEDSPTEHVAADIALKLREEKPEIVAHIVRVVGVKKAIELFEETKSVEEGGGMLVNNWSRRRTPGGVYIQLLKTDPEVSEEQVRDVFREERRALDRQHRRVKRARRRARLAAAAGAAAAAAEEGELEEDSGSDSDSGGAASPAVSDSGGSGDAEDMEQSVPQPDKDWDAELEVPHEIVFE